MTRNVAPRQTRLPHFVPRVKVWLEIGGRYAFGLGIGEILEAVEKTGSIKQAAADLRKSYRHVWGRVKEAEAGLGRQLVETQVGGHGKQRSFLTPEAERLVVAFRVFRERMILAAQQEFTRCLDLSLQSPAE